MLKIRLLKKGRTKRRFFWIVVADVKAPRDGRFKEKIGTYNPIVSNRDTVIKGDRFLFWLFKGAQPTKAVRDLCSAGGLMLVKHLLDGLFRSCIDKKVAHKRLTRWQKVVDKRKKPRLHFETSVNLTELIENPGSYGLTNIPLERPGEEVTKKDTRI